jgi:hypothetical protein
LSPEEIEKMLLGKLKWDPLFACEHVVFLMSLPKEERIAQIAADQAEAKATGRKWLDIGACKSEEPDSESDSDSDSDSDSNTQSTTEDEEGESTKTGTALYHGLLDKPEILGNVFSFFDNGDLIRFSLSSKECARRIKYLVPADDNTWAYEVGQTRQEFLEMLDGATGWFWDWTFCSMCEYLKPHTDDYEYKDWCDSCLSDYGDDEAPICVNCDQRAPHNQDLGDWCDDCSAWDDGHKVMEEDEDEEEDDDE